MGDEVVEQEEPAFHQELAADGGLQSRKLWVVLITMALCVGCGALAAVWQRFGEHLPTVLDSVLMACGIYCGANIGAKISAAVASRKAK
jgi:hypothetical protein